MRKKKGISFVLSVCFVLAGIFLDAGSVQAFSGQTPYNQNTYSHSSVFSGMHIYNGIDVSEKSGVIDWNKVKSAGTEFAMLRVGFRGYGQTGNLCADKQFAANATNATAAGIKVGTYFFSQAVNKTEAVEEAKYVLQQIKSYDISMPVAVDWEYPELASGVKTGRMYEAKLSKKAVTQNLSAFCETICAAGYTPVIYASAYDLSNYMDYKTLGEEYDIWCARYSTKNPTEDKLYTGQYSMWQYAKDVKIDGASKCDLNFWYTKKDINTLPVVDPDNPPKPIILNKVKFTKVINQKGKKGKVTYKKVNQAKGYQIQYATNKKFVGAKTITTKKLSYTIKNLKKKKTYYIKARAYTLRNDKKVYGKWNACKKLKIQK